MNETCKDCGKQFTITQGELDWLTEKGFAPFKRCKACRNKRKEQAQQNDNLKRSFK